MKFRKELQNTASRSHLPKVGLDMTRAVGGIKASKVRPNALLLVRRPGHLMPELRLVVTGKPETKGMQLSYLASKIRHTGLRIQSHGKGNG